MKQAIKQFIKNIMPHETSVVNRLLVSTFVAINRLNATGNFHRGILSAKVITPPSYLYSHNYMI